MTAYAISVEPHRIVIASDTGAYVPAPLPAPPRLVGYTTKILPLPHLRAALFGRGMYRIVAEAALALMVDPRLETVEDIAAALPGLLRVAGDRYCADQHIENGAFFLGEVALVGWSASQLRMIGHFWRSLEDWQREYRLPEGVCAVPALPTEWHPHRGDKSVEEHLVDIMRSQEACAALHFGSGSAIGGEVHLWEFAPTGMRQRVAYAFESVPDRELAARISSGAEVVHARDYLAPVSEVINA